MTSNGYKNRERYSTTLRKDLVPAMEKLHSKTRIPKSKLFDEAVDDLLKKHGIEVPTEK